MPRRRERRLVAGRLASAAYDPDGARRLAAKGIPFELVLAGESEQVATVLLRGGDVERLVIRAIEGSALISKVQLYDRVYSQGFRTQDGTTRPAVEAFRLLNQRLGQG